MTRSFVFSVRLLLEDALIFIEVNEEKRDSVVHRKSEGERENE